MFDDRKVSASDILRILEAGRPCQSGKNLQPWHFIVIRDKTILNALGGAARLFGTELAPDQRLSACGQSDLTFAGQETPLDIPQNQIPVLREGFKPISNHMLFTFQCTVRIDRIFLDVKVPSQ